MLAGALSTLLTLLLFSLCRADVTFQPAHSWAFPEADSQSMILQDSPISDLQGSGLTPLRARTIITSISRPPFGPLSTEDVLPFDSLHANDQQIQGIPVEPDALLRVASPDVADRETLLNLARASWDAYHPTPTPGNWHDIHGLNWVRAEFGHATSRFGWRSYQDGLRGHLFLSPDKKQGLVVFKGTSLSQLGANPTPDDTSRRDRFNDNLLFSCCCANVAWHVKTTHPCNCKVANGKCCSSCLSGSLRSEESYYKHAEMVVRYFRIKYPHTSLWLSGHSLGGSVASLVGIRWGLPTVTFEAPGERLAALRMGLVESIPDALTLSHITHVYNNVDPVAQGLCVGALSLCAQAGYAIEAKCHTSRVIMYDLQKPGWKLAIQAHRMDQVLEILENEEMPVPEAIPQVDCQDCPSWEFGEFERNQRSWWRRLLGWTPFIRHN